MHYSAVNPDFPCPVCGGLGCAHGLSEASVPTVWCIDRQVISDAQAGESANPKYRVLKATVEGVLLAPVGAALVPDAEVLTPREAKRAADEAKYKAKQREKAGTVWGEAASTSKGRERIAGYLAARGIDLDALHDAGFTSPDQPGVPAALRWHQHAPDEWVEAKRMMTTAPAMVARFVEVAQYEGRTARLTSGVHLTYLDPSGAPRKRDGTGEEEAKAKRMLGACKGRAIWLAERFDRPAHQGDAGVLLVGEGIETVLSGMCATRWPGWTLGSTEGYRAWLPPFGLVDPRKPTAVHTIVIGADLNASRLRKGSRFDEVLVEMRQTLVARGFASDEAQGLAARALARGVGELWARYCADRIMAAYPWVRVLVRVPTKAVAPGLVVDVDGEAEPGPGRKGVDWNDVLVAGGAGGKEAVRAGLTLGVNLEMHAAFAKAWKPPEGWVWPDGNEQAEEGEGGVVGGGGVTRVTHAGAASGGERGAGPAVGAGVVAEPWAQRPRDPHGRVVLTEHEKEFAWYDAGALALPERYATAAVIRSAPLDRARLFLLQHCTMPGSRRFRLCRWGETWFWYDGKAWRQYNQERLFGRLQRWLGTFLTMSAGGELAPVHAGSKAVEEVLKSLKAEVLVELTSTPCWLPENLDASGRPLWDQADATSLVRAGEGPADEWTVFADCRIDMMALRRGLVVTRGNTAELFTHAARPFPLPIRDLELALASEADEDAVYRRICPAFWKFAGEITCEEPDRQSTLQLIFGDIMGAKRLLEKIFLFPGFKRGGKGTLIVAMMACVGEVCCASTSFSELGDRFGLAPLVGKSAIFIPDGSVSQFADNAVIVERIKSMSGNDPLSVRDLYQRAQSNVKVNGRIIWFTNDEPDKLRDNSGAFAGRLVIFPLTESFYGREDLSLKSERIPAEAAGIAVYALAGYRKLWSMAQPTIANPAIAGPIVADLERETSPVKAFVDDCLVVGDNCEVTIGDLHKCYEAWCEEHDRQPVGKDKIVAKLRSVVPGLLKSQVRSGKARPRVVRGLGIRGGTPVLNNGAAAGTGRDDPDGFERLDGLPV